jgi:hypothetical protein
MINRLRCLFRNHHVPARHPLGGFRCQQCGEAGADLDEMGYLGCGYVTPIRKIFSRDRGELTHAHGGLGADAPWLVTRRRSCV